MKNETISSFFERDHREIDAIFASIRFEAPQEALSALQEFDGRLERHIRWEEELLFPAVGDKNPMLRQGPLPVMEAEHRTIRAEKAAALDALRAGDGKRARAHAERMLAILKDHNHKEEAILYPACDATISPVERTGLFDKIAAVR